MCAVGKLRQYVELLNQLGWRFGASDEPRQVSGERTFVLGWVEGMRDDAEEQLRCPDLTDKPLCWERWSRERLVACKALDAEQAR